MSMNRIMELHGQGLTCAQILMVLAFEEMGQEAAPELVRAMDGLHTGIGGRGDVCGVLTGGACVLAAFAGGDLTEERDAGLNGMIQEYYDWFSEYNGEFGSNRCDELLGEFKVNKLTRCLKMTEDAYLKCAAILEENDF